VQRVGMLTAAINDYFYVINNAPRDFVLAPEIYLRIGEARINLAQFGLAQDAFSTARELKPDYWPAYVRWIDHLIKTNQKAPAKDLAAEGLRHAPASTELKERYQRLGGDPGKIEPAKVAMRQATPLQSVVQGGTSAQSDPSPASTPAVPGR
jgi:hypothetical protein